MLIRNPKESEVNILKTIWKEVFCDTEEYLNIFFGQVFKPENCLVAEINGKIVSVVYYPEYNAISQNSLLKCGYVCGAATLSEFRGKGIMNSLLNSAISKMKDKGYGGVALIPASSSLFNYYKGFGFVKNAAYREITDFPSTKAQPQYIEKVSNAKSIYGIYTSFLKTNPEILVQSLKSYTTVLAEYEGSVYIYNNSCYMFYNNGTVDEIIGNEKEFFDALSSLEAYLNKKISRACTPMHFLQGIGKRVYNGMSLNLNNFAPSEMYMKLVLE